MKIIIEPEKLKIRCRTWIESKRIQLFFYEHFGCCWDGNIEVPHLPTKRKNLIIFRYSNKYRFSWASQQTFDGLNMVEIQAKYILEFIDKPLCNQRSLRILRDVSIT